MLKKIRCSKITVQVPKANYNKAVEILETLGIKYYFSQTIRTAALKERESFLFFPAKMEIFEDNAEVFKFFIPDEIAKHCIEVIADKLGLNLSGHGGVYAESLEVVNESSIDILNTVNSISKQTKGRDFLIDDLWSISCILQRGEAEDIVKTTLDLGVGAPSVYFGVGTGFRDKIGLLRVTVPAEKEIVNVTVGEGDLNETLATLIKSGKLEEPGRGFIYYYHLGMGIVSSQIVYAKRRHAASMEQIISAVDRLNGDTKWRASTTSSETANDIKMLSDLVCVNMYSNEGHGDELVAIAMSAGSSGATISKAKIKKSLSAENVLPAQEISTMIVGSKNLDNIISAVYDDESHKASFKIIEIKPVPKACTYLG